jgi:hypothetical protein
VNDANAECVTAFDDFQFGAVAKEMIDALDK